MKITDPHFPDKLIISPIDDRPNYWVLNKSFRFILQSPPVPSVITVPAGFVTNFASVPRVLWSIFPPYSDYGKAAVVHDFLYCTEIKTRKRADKLFLEAMKISGVSMWKRHLIYRAVRLFGGPYYDSSEFELIEVDD